MPCFLNVHLKTFFLKYLLQISNRKDYFKIKNNFFNQKKKKIIIMLVHRTIQIINIKEILNHVTRIELGLKKKTFFHP